MNSYTIIDEPKPRPQENLIVNPVVILLAGMILPLFWQPPFFGRIWIPLLWISINGFLLGSPRLKRELLIVIIGTAIWFAMPYFVFFVLQFLGFKDVFSQAVPYIRILNQGVFFLTLYLVCMKQMLAYEIFTYLRKKG